MSRFVDCGRDQDFLLPPDLREWIPEDDLAHFVIKTVERVDWSAFKFNCRGGGSAQYNPQMMLALLIYCYANGIFSSRWIERATRCDIGVRFVSVDTRFSLHGPNKVAGKWHLVALAYNCKRLHKLTLSVAS